MLSYYDILILLGNIKFSPFKMVLKSHALSHFEMRFRSRSALPYAEEMKLISFHTCKSKIIFILICLSRIFLLTCIKTKIHYCPFLSTKDGELELMATAVELTSQG